tara:strand:+ start:5685 stop:6908 length:1224 start_codon:yes stop_codon:yes gene_type:complete
MIKSTLIYILEDNTLNFASKNPTFFENFFTLKNSFSNSCVINISNLTLNKNLDDVNELLKLNNVDYFIPKTLEELSIFFETKNCIGFLKLYHHIKHHKILRVLKKNDVKLIQISSFNFIFEKKLFEKKPLKHSLRILFNIRILNYMHRIMTILGFYPRIAIHFESDQTRIDLINISLSKKLEKLFPFLKFSFYEKIIRINSKYYSNTLVNKIVNEEKYVTLCDSPLVHGDLTLKEGINKKENIENYYKNLCDFLDKIKLVLKKEIVICIHPKGVYDQFENFRLIKEKYKVVLHQTEKYIEKSFLVLFTVSSTYNHAIIQGRNIALIKSKYIGSTASQQIMNIKKELDLFAFDIDDDKNFDESCFSKIINSKEKISNYSFKKLFYKKGVTDNEQVVEHLTNYIKTYNR